MPWGRVRLPPGSNPVWWGVCLPLYGQQQLRSVRCLLFRRWENLCGRDVWLRCGSNALRIDVLQHPERRDSLRWLWGLPVGGQRIPDVFPWALRVRVQLRVRLERDRVCALRGFGSSGMFRGLQRGAHQLWGDVSRFDLGLRKLWGLRECVSGIGGVLFGNLFGASELSGRWNPWLRARGDCDGDVQPRGCGFVFAQCSPGASGGSSLDICDGRERGDGGSVRSVLGCGSPLRSYDGCVPFGSGDDGQCGG